MVRPGTHVRMWEARCAPGRTDEAVTWAQQRAASDAMNAGATGAEVFFSEDRVVLITRWAGETSWTEPTPDAAVVERSHVWPFESAG